MKKYSIILLFYTFIFPSFQYIIDQESEEPTTGTKAPLNDNQIKIQIPPVLKQLLSCNDNIQTFDPIQESDCANNVVG